MQPGYPIGVGPLEVDTAGGGKDSGACRNEILNRLAGPALVGRQRRAFGRAHQRTLRVNVSVPDLLAAQGAFEAWARHTVGLVRLPSVPPDLLWGVNIVDTAQQFGMQRLNVVGLAVAVSDGLPIGIDFHGERGVAAKITQPAPRDVFGYRVQVIHQWHRGDVETDEDQALPGLDPHGQQREVGHVQRAETLAIGHSPQFSGQIPGPAVVAALQFTQAPGLRRC